MKTRHLMLLTLAMWGSGLVYAAPVTYYFGGTLTSVDNVLSPHLSAGAPFSGSFTFDSNSPDSNPNPSVGIYTPAPAFSLNINGILFSTTGSAGSIQVDNVSFSGARFSASAAISGPDLNNYQASGILLDFQDFDATAFVDDALPLGGLNLADFESARLILVFIQSPAGDPLLPGVIRPIGSLGYISLTAPNATSIPEPNTLTLFGLALAGLAALRRRLPLDAS